jgi:predicted  nucleic acid-binding Zn-ribbon protein
MRYLIRCLVLCLVVTAAAVPAGARGRATPPDAAKASAPAGPPVTIAALKAQANQAASKFAAAQVVFETLGDQVAALERQVDELEARLAPLRQEVTRQAVAVYQGDVAVAAVNHIEAAAAMMRSDRAAHLVADMTARRLPAIDTLLAAKQRVKDRQTALQVRRHEQDVAMASLTAQRDQISRELEQLAAALPPKADRHQPKARASRGAGFGTTTWSPHGPEPYAAATRAAGQAPSSKPGCCQPSGAVCDAFQDAPVLPVAAPCSSAITEAGPAEVLVAAIAMVFAPARTCAVTSTVVARFHESVTRRDVLTRVPLTQTSAVSSPVTTRVVRPGAATSTVRRK